LLIPTCRDVRRFMKIQLDAELNCNQTIETKAETATLASAETNKQTKLGFGIGIGVSAYLVKIVAFHCLPFQLCATRRMHNVVMKWAHSPASAFPQQPFWPIHHATHKYFGQK